MRRREFITLLGGAAAAWPLAARAQQGERVRRIGRARGLAADDPEAQVRVAAFRQRPANNWAGPTAATCTMVYRLGGGDCERVPRAGRGIGRRSSWTSSWPLPAPAWTPLLQATRDRADRVRAGRRSGRRQVCREPGAARRQHHRLHAASNIESGGKWLELLKEMAPRHQARGSAREMPTKPSGEPDSLAVHPSRRAVVRGGVDVLSAVRDAPEIERAVDGVRARPAGDGADRADRDPVRGGPPRSDHRAGGPAQVARGLLFRYCVPAGGLMSYGTEHDRPVPEAASYVDRILKGEKPADLPVQAPTRYRVWCSTSRPPRRSASTCRPACCVRADEVIE